MMRTTKDYRAENPEHFKKLARQLYYTRLARGDCGGCGKYPKLPDKTVCAHCNERRLAYARKIAHPLPKKTKEEKLLARRATSAKYRNKNPLLCLQRTHQNHIERRLQIFAHYGQRCACCGESRYELLTVDHVNNDGKAHRMEIGGGGKLYRWLIINNFPPGFQILCMNCNWAKSRYGECPHERERRQDHGGACEPRRWELVARQFGYADKSIGP